MLYPLDINNDMYLQYWHPVLEVHILTEQSCFFLIFFVVIWAGHTGKHLIAAAENIGKTSAECQSGVPQQNRTNGYRWWNCSIDVCALFWFPEYHKRITILFEYLNRHSALYSFCIYTPIPQGYDRAADIKEWEKNTIWNDCRFAGDRSFASSAYNPEVSQIIW